MQQLTLELGKHPFPFEVVRSRRKSLVIYVKGGKVEIRAPLRASEKWIKEFLSDKTLWVQEQLAEQRRRQQQHMVLAEGTRFTLAGEPMTLRIALARQPKAVRHGSVLTLYLKERKQAKVEQLFHEWLQEQAKEYMPPKVRDYARKLGVEHKFSKVTWRKTRTKWGHCDDKGVIQFNWLLMLAPKPVLDYLIAHETSHLCVLNHSARYWRIVASVCANYKKHRQWLMDNGHRLWPQGSQ